MRTATIEEQALIACLDEDDDTARHVVNRLLQMEAFALAKAARRLAELAEARFEAGW